MPTMTCRICAQTFEIRPAKRTRKAPECYDCRPVGKPLRASARLGHRAFCSGCGADIEGKRPSSALKCGACKEAKAKAKSRRQAAEEKARRAAMGCPARPRLPKDWTPEQHAEHKRQVRRAETIRRIEKARIATAPERERRAAEAEARKAAQIIAAAEKRAAREAEKIERHNARPWLAAKTPAEAFRIRYANDPDFAVGQRLRSAMRRKRQGYKIADLLRSALKRNGKTNVEALLGYSVGQLRAHIERQFRGKMTWAAFHEGRIHIDHIVPLSTSAFRAS